ncbi:MAG: PQQ-binding-like beta-propeller repeat protein [Verrucomicrobia bacterium]|nr:PQQ-binding-like beta-propeller repeat protein [Verrucomicrobiota bacterium]MDA1066387.1 PQQ-binding-like beta-propeller repeat protein [Verrucomicrobiota bacterium]
MKRWFSLLFILILAVSSANAQWNQWRGAADGQGEVSGKGAVTEWSENKNIIWKSPVTGRGSSSPIISGGKIFLTTADEKRNKTYLLCYDQKTGKKLWEKLVFWGELLNNVHKNNTHASPSVATDGETVTVLFGFKKAIWLAAYTIDGKGLWEKEVAKVKSNFGFGSSPLVYKKSVIVLCDMEPNPVLVAYNLLDGKELWKSFRDGPDDADFHSYSTPRIFNIQGKDQLVTVGLGRVKFYDPDSGKMLWDVEAGSDATVGTPLLDRRYLYLGGGWPQMGCSAIDLRRREVIWKNRFDAYIVSLVFHEDYLYGSTNKGEFACMDAKSGMILWRERFRTEVQASPFIAGGLLYLILRDGTTKVIKPDSTKYIEVSENHLPGITDATPAIVDGLMYYRSENMLYCIGEG